MGRAKAILKRIQDSRVRKATFLQRRKGLVKKVSDFSTICEEAQACLIVYDEDGDAARPEIWPQDPTVVHSILQKYECDKKNKAPMEFDLEEFFEIKKKTVEDEIRKVRKEIMDVKYPTWDPIFLDLGKEKLVALMGELDAKISACGHRINMLINMQQSEVIKPNMAQVQDNEDISQTELIPAPINPVNDDNCGMVDSTNQDNVSLNNTNQLVEPGLEDWTCKLLELDDWANQLRDDLAWWSNQSDESLFQNTTFELQNQQQGEPNLPPFPESLDGF